MSKDTHKRKFGGKIYDMATFTWDKAEASKMAKYLRGTYHYLVRVTHTERKKTVRHGSKRGFKSGTAYVIWKRKK
jgi:hypothetical protein